MDDDNMLDFSLWGDTPIIDMKSCILAEKSCVNLEPTKPTLESKFPPPKDFCQTF